MHIRGSDMDQFVYAMESCRRESSATHDPFPASGDLSLAYDFWTVSSVRPSRRSARRKWWVVGCVDGRWLWLWWRTDDNIWMDEEPGRLGGIYEGRGTVEGMDDWKHGPRGPRGPFLTY